MQLRNLFVGAGGMTLAAVSEIVALCPRMLFCSQGFVVLVAAVTCVLHIGFTVTRRAWNWTVTLVGEVECVLGELCG